MTNWDLLLRMSIREWFAVAVVVAMLFIVAYWLAIGFMGAFRMFEESKQDEDLFL